MMENWLVSWAISHQQYLIGVASGAALAHLHNIVAFGVHQVLRVPLVRQAVAKDPEKAKALIRQIEQEIETDIDKEVK